MRSIIGKLTDVLFPWRPVIRHMSGEIQVLRDEIQTLRDKTSEINKQADSILDHTSALSTQISDSHNALSERITEYNKDFASLHGEIRESTSSIRNCISATKKRRLFISTGYFSTLLAAAIIRQGDARYEEYLLITIDRQSKERNIRWAHQVFDDWTAVHLIDHIDYYETEDGVITSPYSDVEFDLVFSPFPEMREFVQKNFPSKQYSYYEEGLASYINEITTPQLGIDDRFYLIQPAILEAMCSASLSPISRTEVIGILEKNVTSYRIPTFSGDRNIIYLLSGGLDEEKKDADASWEHTISIIKKLREHGFTVWIKPHPRIRIHSELRSNLSIPDIHWLSADVPIVEMLLVKNQKNIAAVVSPFSTLLINTWHLFGIPSFSTEEKIGNLRQLAMKTLVNTSIPVIDQHLNHETFNPHQIYTDFLKKQFTENSTDVAKHIKDIPNHNINK